MEGVVSSLEGLKVRIEVLGCRTNQYEADALADAFVAGGASLVDGPPWDVALLLSCSVTSAADGKSRQLLRRLKRRVPEALVVAVGCWAQRADDDEIASVGVDLVVGNGRKAELVGAVEALIEGRLPAGTVLRQSLSPPARWDPLFMGRPHLHSRAFVKVQDGCDHFCSYCIIPRLRGHPQSRPLDDVLGEIGSVVASGCPEVILTGIHLGLYGRDLGLSLADLVGAVASVKGLKRLRFGSLEPFALDDSLLALLAASPVFSPHLHLPLQSGDDEVLVRMRRGYGAADFRALVGRLRRLWGDDLHISTDLLVGFPGETEAAFGRSLDLLQALNLGRLHVFPFSPRKGTEAASLPGRLSPEVLRERCRRAIDLGERLLSRYARRWVDREVQVVVENSEGGGIGGLSAHYLDVEAPGRASVGDVVTLRVEKEVRGRLLAFPLSLSVR
ncbi:MiaB/RimO family radical SAM methylthiotransferase [Aminithiophilus ramosus]|uniref:MiaB/RimO family radical SAM methylthiotransferase n=1 Tax=Aminithiophilus ramosus TaxID=3029084 RepID=A0A9Q7A9X0_9BACT|nr:MiaB/RimO family radical SAM methylthiotransferase [Aminithiophilus ramosus]QTX33165.1 MiaB/RimO family radical SAM methylthiotransferase [Aminithiophilus ramosus]